jgi:hypothetical protein
MERASRLIPQTERKPSIWAYSASPNTLEQSAIRVVFTGTDVVPEYLKDIQCVLALKNADYVGRRTHSAEPAKGPLLPHCRDVVSRIGKISENFRQFVPHNSSAVELLACQIGGSRGYSRQQECPPTGALLGNRIGRGAQVYD